MVHRIVLSLVFVVALAAPAAAAPFTFRAFLSGPGESPPNASPATGIATVIIDAATHRMEVDAQFAGLMGPNSAAHIHVINGPGDAITADTLGPVATTTPTFAGFPVGTAGVFQSILDMTLASSYRGAFITDAGGIAQAEAALFAGITDGRAYFNIHSTVFPGGEIRGFLQAVPEPGTLLLLGAGLGGLVRMRRRRQN